MAPQEVTQQMRALGTLLALAVTALLVNPLSADAAERGRGKRLRSEPAAKKRPAPPRRPPRANPAPAIVSPAVAPAPPASGSTTDPAATPAPAPAARPGKPRVYTFGGLDLEGKLKTPQLLYFRSRLRQELDTSSPPRRSFMKELEATADAQGL